MSEAREFKPQLVERLEPASNPSYYVGNKGICTYCGDTAECVDHIIPLMESLRRRRKPSKKYRNGYGPMSYSCKDCNGGLNAKTFSTFLTRCDFAHSRLERLAKPVNWSLEELSTLKGTLRDFVLAERSKRLQLRWRADWFESRDFFLNLEGLLWSPAVKENNSLHLYFLDAVTAIRELLSANK